MPYLPGTSEFFLLSEHSLEAQGLGPGGAKSPARKEPQQVKQINSAENSSSAIREREMFGCGSFWPWHSGRKRITE